MEDSTHKKADIEKALLLMLEKSGIGVEYHPIIFEYCVHLFKLETADLRNLRGNFIYSTDKTLFNISTATLKVSKKRILRSFLRVGLFFAALIINASLPGNAKKYQNSILFFGVQKELLKSKNEIRNLTQYLYAKFPQLFDPRLEIIFECKNRLMFSFFNSSSRTSPLLVMKILRDNFPIQARWKIILTISGLVCRRFRKNLSIFFIAPERFFLEFPIWHTILSELRFKVVATQSKLELLPLPFFTQNSQRFMVWYSNNSLPFRQIGQKPLSPRVATNSNFIDHHFVWSDSH